MNVNLSEKMQAFVDEKVSSGQFASADEVFELALQELQNTETGELDARWLKAKLAVGRLSIEDGESLPLEEAMKRIRSKAARLAGKVRS